jgi:hypothetical protein
MNDKETENALIVIQYLKQLFIIMGGVLIVKLVSVLITTIVQSILN